MAAPSLIAISNDQLVGIIAQTVREAVRLNTTEATTALTTALEGLNLGQRNPTGGSTKDIKFGKIHSFNGKSEDFQPFIQECFVRLELQKDIYTAAATKAAFMLSYFDSGSTRLWKEAYYAERAGKPFVEDDDFDAFIDHLQRHLYVLSLGTSVYIEVGRRQADKDIQRIEEQERVTGNVRFD
jgi:hypothetical protein